MSTEARTAAREGESGSAEQSQVSPLELFSDLVFVFAITQLTTVLVQDQTWAGALHVLLIFGMIWWMYGGYIWLTNAVRPDRPVRKLLLLGGMAGFLIIGLAIPRAFQGDGIIFGLGYLIVVLIHTAAFFQVSRPATRAGIVRIAPFNVVCAVLLIIAGSRSPAVETALWIGALAIQVLPPFLIRTERFQVEPGHFVERYNLLVLIALGESLVAVGANGRRFPLSFDAILLSLLGLALTAALWWTYFGDDATRAEKALTAAPMEQRPMKALLGFFYAQIPMLLGIVCIAAAIRTVQPDPRVAGLHQALLLSGGAAAFLAGDLFFRATFRLPLSRWRILAIPLALTSVVIGDAWSLMAQLGLVAGMLIAASGAEMLQARQASVPSAAASSISQSGS